jgi:8-oxo-dGTP pyrophosphatase MutT (NUDIX family)
MNYDKEPKFRLWKDSLIAAGCRIHRIDPVSLLHKKNGELLFGLFKVDATAPEGTRLLPYAMVRGDACVIVPLIRNTATNEFRLLMVKQRRIGNGRVNLEFPAGMLDRHAANPAACAAKELEEEAHLTIAADALAPLHNKPLYTSAGLQDEAILYYGCIVDVAAEQWHALEGASSGEAAEGEHIIIALKTLRQARAEAESGQVLLGLFLFEQYCRGIGAAGTFFA